MSGGQGGLILEYSKFWMKSLGTFEVITAVYLAGSADCRKVTKYLYHNKQTKSTQINQRGHLASITGRSPGGVGD